MRDSAGLLPDFAEFHGTQLYRRVGGHYSRWFEALRQSEAPQRISSSVAPPRRSHRKSAKNSAESAPLRALPRHHLSGARSVSGHTVTAAGSENDDLSSGRRTSVPAAQVSGTHIVHYGCDKFNPHERLESRTPAGGGSSCRRRARVLVGSCPATAASPKIGS